MAERAFIWSQLKKMDSSHTGLEALTNVGQAPYLRYFSEHFPQDTGASPSFVRRSELILCLCHPEIFRSLLPAFLLWG